MVELSPMAKMLRLEDPEDTSCDVETVKAENESLKQEVLQLKKKVCALEKELGRGEKGVWQLCPEHVKDGKAFGCSEMTGKNMCPSQPPPTSFQDLNSDVVRIIFRYLDRDSALTCRLVSKTWKSHFGCDLHMAAHKGNPEDVRMLIAEGRNVNQLMCLWKNVKFAAPLHFAATCSSPSHIEVVKLLIGAGADLNIRNCSGNTPLHIAVVDVTPHSGELVKMLLKAGADIEFKNCDGRTPLFSAFNHSQYSAFNHSQFSHSEQSIMNLNILIESGAVIDATDCHGQTALLSLISDKSYMLSIVSAVARKKIKILLEAGANPNPRDILGSTILHWVVSRIIYDYIKCEQDISDCLEVMSLVLAAGCDTTIRDSCNRTAMELADWHYDSFDDSGRAAIERVRQLLG